MFLRSFITITFLWKQYSNSEELKADTKGTAFALAGSGGHVLATWLGLYLNPEVRKCLSTVSQCLHYELFESGKC